MGLCVHEASVVEARASPWIAEGASVPEDSEVAEAEHPPLSSEAGITNSSLET